MSTFVIYADTTDGQLSSSGSVYATVQAGSSLSAGAAAGDFYLGQWKNGATYTIWEAFVQFDTSGVTDTPTSAVLTLTPDDASAGDIGTIYARAVDWGSSLTTADWIAAGSLSGNSLRASLATGSLVNGTAADFTSDGSFVSNVTSPVRLALCTSQVEAGTTPTTYQGAAFYSAEATGTTNDPKLTIVTAVPTAKSASDTVGVSDSGAQDLRLVGPGATTTVVSDAMTDSDGTLLSTHAAGWTRVSASNQQLEIQSNKLTVRNPGPVTGIYSRAEEFTDGKMSAVLTTATGGYAGLYLRLSGSNGYALFADNGGYYTPGRLVITEYPSGTDLGYVDLAWVSGDTVAFETVGPSLRALVNGVVKLEVTDTSLTSGAPAITINASAVNQGVLIDDLLIESYATTGEHVSFAESAARTTISGASASDTATVTESATRADYVVDKSASDTFSVADTAAPWNLITPQAGSGSWSTRAMATAKVLASVGGDGSNNYPFGAAMPNGDIRVWYSDVAATRTGTSVSTDGGLTFGSHSVIDFFGAILPGVTGSLAGGAAGIRRGRSGRYHAALNTIQWYSDGSYTCSDASANGPYYGTTPAAGPINSQQVNWPTAIGCDIEYTPYYAYSDDGVTWSTPVAVPIPVGTYGAVAIDVWELTNGDLMLSWYGNGTGAAGSHGATVGFYPDCGFSYCDAASGVWTGTGIISHGSDWTSVTTVPEPWASNGGPWCTEPMGDVIHDGSAYGKVVCCFTAPDYGGVSRKRVFTSSNAGSSWTDTGNLFYGVNRIDLCATPDRDLVMTYCNSSYAPVFRVSQDGGTTWSAETTMASSYEGTRWVSPFPIDDAGVSPNVGVAWGTGSVDITGSTYYRSLTAGSTGWIDGRGQESFSVTDAAGVSALVGSITKTASDSFSAADTTVGPTVTVHIRPTGASDLAIEAFTATDSSTTTTTLVGVSASDVFYFTDASGTGVPSTNRRPYWWLHRKRVLSS